MEIKMTLRQLTSLFAASAAANEELPKPIREFAAQCAILAAHTERVDMKTNATMRKLQALEKIANEMAEAVTAVAVKSGAIPTSSPEQTQPQQPPPQEGEEEEDASEDDVAAMVAQAIKDTETDTTTAAAPAGGSVTPLRKTPDVKPSADKKAPTGGAA